MREHKLDTYSAICAVLDALSVNIRDQIREALRLDLEDAEVNGCPPEIGMHFNMDDLLGSGIEYEIHDDYSGTLRKTFGRFGDFEIELQSNGEVIVWLLLEDRVETDPLDFTPAEKMQLCVYVYRYIELVTETYNDPEHDEFVRHLEVKMASWFKVNGNDNGDVELG